MLNFCQSIDTTNFSDVWGRVTCQTENLPQNPIIEPCPIDSDATNLRKLIDDTAVIIEYCRKTIKCCPGKATRSLTCIYNCEREHIKRLRAKYYILTGQSHNSCDTCLTVYTVTEALRGLYSAEETALNDYKTAADQTQRTDLKIMFEQYAEDEICNINTITRLVECLFC